jgi:hypothetical protein
MAADNASKAEDRVQALVSELAKVRATLRYYVLDEQKTPVLCPDQAAWWRWRDAMTKTARHDWETVGRDAGDTGSDGISVSTFFEGIDHRRHGEGPPLLWETLISEYYTSYAAALEGHERWCQVRAVAPPTDRADWSTPYVIWSAEYGGWRTRKGYSFDLARAWHYAKADADDILAHGTATMRAVALHDADTVIVSYRCPSCGAQSFNPQDIRDRYCAVCRAAETPSV